MLAALIYYKAFLSRALQVNVYRSALITRIPRAPKTSYAPEMLTIILAGGCSSDIAPHIISVQVKSRSMLHHGSVGDNFKTK